MIAEFTRALAPGAGNRRLIGTARLRFGTHSQRLVIAFYSIVVIALIHKGNSAIPPARRKAAIHPPLSAGP